MDKIKEYYRDEEERKLGVKIPDYVMVGMWQRQAYKEIKNILLQPDGESLFNRMYEFAWQKLKERLP